jgi:hypothetical protein
MEPDEILRKAWEAVERAGVPESLQDTAFREAVDILRSDDNESGGKEISTSKRRRGKGRADSRKTEEETGKVPLPDEDAFFTQLASESGVAERDLRDVLSLSDDGSVVVTTPTKDLGSSIAEQAKNVIALVASGRSVGLGERPVSAAAVRDEAKRKRCYQKTTSPVSIWGR